MSRYQQYKIIITNPGYRIGLNVEFIHLTARMKCEIVPFLIVSVVLFVLCLAVHYSSVTIVRNGKERFFFFFIH